jgi:uncharacterized protein (TIGR02265 family)
MRFVEPGWNTALDARAEIAEVPEEASISGMFLAPLALEAKRRGITLHTARDRYLPFKFYPLREHMKLLVETCEKLHADRPLRQALRKLGRGAPAALVASTLGKVVLGSVEGVHAIVEGMAKAYPLNVRPCRVEAVDAGPRRMIVRLSDVHYFLDSHHVGAFEGALRYAGVHGTVRIAPRGRTAADFLLEWSERPPVPSSVPASGRRY